MSAQGLENAPFTKGLLLACVGASVFTQAALRKARAPAALQAASRLLVFQSPGELVFGVFLLYYFRVLERQTGTAKFGAFAAIVTGLASVVQVALLRLFRVDGSPASGPYGLIFACLVQFFVSIPPSSTFTVLGFKLSDKTFTYLAGLQLLLIGGRATLAAGTAGIVAGCLYKANFLGIKKLRFPAAVNRFFASTVGALLRDGTPQQSHSNGRAQGSSGGRARGSATAAGAGAGQHPQHAAQRRGPPQQVQQAQRAAPHEPSEEAVHRLMEMGFERGQAMQALQACDDDVDQAINLLVS